MTHQERVSKLRDWGFSYRTISANSVNWNGGKRLSVRELRAMNGDKHKQANDKWIVIKLNMSNLSGAQVDDIEFICECKNRGKTNEQIANMLGSTESSVKNAISRYLKNTNLK